MSRPTRIEKQNNQIQYERKLSISGRKPAEGKAAAAAAAAAAAIKSITSVGPRKPAIFVTWIHLMEREETKRAENEGFSTRLSRRVKMPEIGGAGTEEPIQE